MRKFRDAFQVALLISLLTIPIGHAYARQVQGSLTGTVLDSSGAAIQGAEVKIVNQGTNLRQSTRTDSNGVYTFPDLPLGAYSVTFVKDGFKTEEHTRIVIQANRSTTVDGALQPGEVSATITVTASPLLNQTDPTNGYVLSTSVIESTPLGTGSFTQLAILSPGVNADLLSGADTNAGLGNQAIYANGQRDTSNSFSINAIGSNNLFNGKSASAVGENRFVLNTGEQFLRGGQIQTNTSVYSAIGQSLPTPPPETIEELRVNTSMYDATQGANSGAHIELITRSGTNSYHGQLYEHFQNDIFNAAPFFFNADPSIPKNQKVPELRRNAFGGTIGGPIKGDKLFFFASYQGVRVRDGLNGTSSVTVPLQLTNDRSATTLAKQFGLSANQLDPAAVKLLNAKSPLGGFLIPTPSIDAVTASSLGFDAILQGPASVFSADQANANVDYIVNSKDRIAAKYYYQHDPSASPFAISSLAGSTQRLVAGSQVFSLTNTTVINPHLVWEQKVGFIRETAFAATDQPLTPADAGINLFGIKRFPGININTSDATIGSSLSFGPTSNFSNAGEFQNQFSVGSNLHWVKGRHSLSFGGNFDLIQLNVVNRNDDTATLTFNTFSDFLTGTVNPFQTTLFTGSANRYYRSNQFGLYAQDSFKIKSNLTLNFGLRFDYDGPLTEKYGHLTNFDPRKYKYDLGTDTISNDGLVVAGNNHGFATPGTNNSTLNNLQYGLAPRVGVAWNPSFAKHLVVRGGFGLYFDRGQFFTEFSPSAGFGFNGPFGVTLEPPFVQQIFATKTGTLSNPFGTTAPANVTGNPNVFAAQVPNLAALENGATPFLFGGYDPNNKLPYTMNWSFDLQWQPRDTLVLTLGYVGNHGRREVLPIPFNQPGIATPGHPINGQNYSYGFQVPGLSTEPFNTSTGGNTDLRVPFVGYSPNSVFWTAEGISNYHALQFSVNKRISKGLQVNGSYTWSHSLDQGSGQGLFYNGNDPLHPQSGYASSDFDRTHVLAISYLYQLPNVAKEKSLLSKIINDWSIAGVTVVESGQPYNVYDFSGAIAGIFYGTNDFITNPIVPIGPGFNNNSVQLQSPTSSDPGKPVLNAAGFTIPLLQPGQSGVPPCERVSGKLVCDTFESGYGATGRNTFRGPFQTRFDFSVAKMFRFTEKVGLRYRAEFFNLFNTPSFDTPNNNVEFDPTFDPVHNGFRIPPSGRLGIIQHPIGSPRFVQMSLALSF
jgi:hypothetical protein